MQEWSAYKDCVDRSLRLFGFNPAMSSDVDVSLGDEDVSFGDRLSFEAGLAGSLAYTCGGNM